MTTPSLPIDQRTREGAAIADLFRRIKNVEESTGDWRGGEVIDVLSQWFAELHIDVDDGPDDVRYPQAGTSRRPSAGPQVD